MNDKMIRDYAVLISVGTPFHSEENVSKIYNGDNELIKELLTLRSKTLKDSGFNNEAESVNEAIKLIK